jgi:hypothetical protein
MMDAVPEAIARGRNTIVFDIDGVIANCHARLHHILEKPVDWPAFDAETMNDKPIPQIIRLMNLVAINPFVKIILLTGRADRDGVREMTTEWLIQHGASEYDELIMRTNGDHRPAMEMKLDKLMKRDIWPVDVITIFEDHPCTIKGLRKFGYHVSDVGGWCDNYTEILTEGGPDANSNKS